MTTHQTRSGAVGPIDEERSHLLRLVLKLDAVATGALGVLSLAAAPALDGLLAHDQSSTEHLACSPKLTAFGTGFRGYGGASGLSVSVGL